MYKHILVPLDGSATAERGFREALQLATEQKSKLSLLHVIDDFPMLLEMSSVANFEDSLRKVREYGEQVLAKGRSEAAKADVPVDTFLREVTNGRVADVVIKEASALGCDLIVMGTHGRRGFSRLALGSDADRVVRASPVPVLLVREADASDER
ncbi:universal stress protein [Variovorax defluvii]|uniref:Universal stress protein n=1 Tax=Variovorax defluvii TaxID=913761 RepID=A0ABP8IAF0_9BURK